MNFDFTSMIAYDKNTNIAYPMRIDTEAGMIDVWNPEINEYVWNDFATKAFKNHLGSGTLPCDKRINKV